jgi:DNA helicase HerA-like ATPase
LAQTFAADRYSEKFIGSLTLAQSAVMLALTVPGVLLITSGAGPTTVAPYGLFLILAYAGISYFEADQRIMEVLKFLMEKRRLNHNARRMRQIIGVKDIDFDSVFTLDNRILSVIRVFPRDLGSLSETDIERCLAGYGAFLNSLSSSIQIIMSSAEVDIENYIRAMEDRIILEGDPRKLEYFSHYQSFLRGVTSSKTIADRDYHIIITQNMGENLRQSLNDLASKTRNVTCSLQDSGIDCRRLDTGQLIVFYSNFLQPRMRFGAHNWSPVTFHKNLELMMESEKYLKDFQVSLRPDHPLWDELRHPVFTGDGHELLGEPLDRQSHIISEILPSMMEFHRDHVLAEKLHTILCTVRFPAVVSPGWLTRLIRLPIDFDIVFHIHPLSQKSTVEYLQNELTKLETDVTAKQHQGLLVPERDRVSLQKVRDLLSRVSRDEEKCFDLALYVNVKAYDKKELDIASSRVRQALEGLNARVKTARWEMEPAIKTCYPLAKDALGAKRDKLFPSSAVRDSFPFILSNLSQPGPGAVVAGYNQLNGIPVLLDGFTQPNPHTLVLGASGAGKSFLIKKIILNHALNGDHIFLIDPQGEYSRTVSQMSGEIIRLAPDSGNTINLLDLSNTSYDERKSSVKAFFNIIQGDFESQISGASIGIIDRMLDNAYRKKGVYSDDKSTWDNVPPTFQDIYEALNQYCQDPYGRQESWKKASAEAILTHLTPFISGDMKYLNRQTNISLKDAKITCFDISSTANQKPIPKALALFTVFDFIQSRAKKLGRQCRKHIIVDEAWTVFENNQDYLGPIVRTGRKENLAVTIIDQNVEDLLRKDAAGNTRGHIILNNTSTKFILRQEAAALRLVTEKFALTEGQTQFLKSAGTGDALLITPAAKIPLFILASEYEKRLLNTTPQLKEEKTPEFDAEFDPRHDDVIPAGFMAAFNPELMAEFIKVKDEGVDGQNAIYYVRPEEGITIPAKIRRDLIMKKLLEKARLYGARIQSHTHLLPHITVTTADDKILGVEMLESQTQDQISQKTAGVDRLLLVGCANIRESDYAQSVHTPQQTIKIIDELMGGGKWTDS